MKKDKQQGSFVISLDFELLYGMNDKSKLERWTKTALGARLVIPELLQLFQQNEIHATWGIVGMLYAKNKEMWHQMQPEILPQYENSRFSNYIQAEVGADEEKDPLHYAPSLIRQIAATPNQEIGSHTFSHYYCMEKGQTKESFEADVKAAIHMHENYFHDINCTDTCQKQKIQSLIFPKNQFQGAYLEILKKYGITAVRGNEKGAMYCASESGERMIKRGMRLLDSYVNLSGYHTYAHQNLEKINGILDIPSSRFLRPYSKKLCVLEGLKINRIKGQMRHAAKKGEIFHLWWHPHNFGSNTEKNMENLQKIIAYYKKLQIRYGMQSSTMEEICSRI